MPDGSADALVVMLYSTARRMTFRSVSPLMTNTHLLSKHSKMLAT
jgi:hypothetical protein